MTSKRVYFPGLNALRFFAAISVVFYHIEYDRSILGFGGDRFFLADITLFGPDGVILFFVLSGFLITYLLMVEAERTESVHISKFYLRRALRIWPLYYLVTLLGFFFIPLVIKLTAYDGYYVSVGNDFPQNLILYALFLPNVAAALDIIPIGISQLWSIGVEEQFYLIWPWLIRWFKKNILLLMGLVIGIKIALYIYAGGLEDKTLYYFLTNLSFESMAIGGIGAYLVHRKHPLLKVIYHPVASFSVLVLMVIHVMFVSSIDIGPLPQSRFLTAPLYILFILNLADNPRFGLKLENRLFHALGNLSYGIYMYHLLVIYLVRIAFWQFNITDLMPLYNPFLYTVVTTLTIGISALSYTQFERPFLALKDRFAVIHSGTATGVRSSWLERMLSRLGFTRTNSPSPDTD